MSQSNYWWAGACLALLVAAPAAAYLDPASGSMMLQLLLAGAAGAAVALKLVWGRLLGLFGVRRPAPPDAAAEEGAEPPGDV